MDIKAAIVIPVYKPILKEDEVKSLQQCFKIFKDYPICFACGKSFQIKNYEGYLENKKYEVKRFDDKYFASIDGYSILMLSLNFYKSFYDYDYILLYQLDAWVFKKELSYWCEQSFSYIGAPWLSGWFFADKNSFFIGVGNGGFSLRKVKDHITVLKKFKYYILPKRYLKTFKNSPSIRSLKELIRNIFFRNNPFFFYYNYPYDYPIHEDVFWGRIASRVFRNFTVPDAETALHFAVETVPSKFVNELNIPFGCHAWSRMEPEFWKHFIKT